MKINKINRGKSILKSISNSRENETNTPEIIAWTLFFGLGVSYFVMTLIYVL